MKAAIIGTGFLGQQICEDIAPHCEKLILTHNQHKKYPDSRKFDFFTDDVGDILGDEKVDVIFLPAKIEFEKDEKKVAESMERFLKGISGARIIYVSSDGIFDGQKGGYSENDEANPLTLYGRNLKICEELIKKYSKDYCIIRPSYMYGRVNGELDSRFRKIQEEIHEGKEIVRFTDMYKSPLSYKQASEAIVKAAESEFVGTMHVGGPRMSVYDFTKEGMEALGIPTKNLAGKAMPKERPIDFLPDTSLDNALMKNFTEIKPLGVKESFEKFYGSEIKKEVKAEQKDIFKPKIK